MEKMKRQRRQSVDAESCSVAVVYMEISTMKKNSDGLIHHFIGFSAMKKMTSGLHAC
jgi:hypothetical protein